LGKRKDGPHHNNDVVRVISELLKAVRAEPGTFLVTVPTPACLPLKNGPIRRHLIFAFVATKGDAELRIVAVLNCPLANLMTDPEIVNSIQIL
jgi:hypothetical protein